MPDKAIISHRGEKYEIGRGRRFYGIWVLGAPYDAPVDRWPETRDGWGQAWARFAAIETPGTIVAVSRRPGARPWRLRQGGSADDGGAGRAGAQRAGSMLLAGEGLLVLGVVLGIVGLFPAYFAGQSLLSQSYQFVTHLCYVVAWTVSAGLIAIGVTRPGTARLGALFGLGLSVVTFGMFLADLGRVTAGGVTLGAGLVLSLAGWAACTAGLAIALVVARHDGAAATVSGGPAAAGLAGSALAGPRDTRLGRPTMPSLGHAGPLALLLLAGLGTAAAYAPSWDSYTLSMSATGASQTVTAGNAFASTNPGLVIAGEVAVMVAVALAAALAALWRPARQGALLLAGAIVPLAAEAVSAIIQAGQPATPGMFGISQAQASASGLTISSGLTPIFWVYCVFVLSLVISCAWLFTAPGHSVMSPLPAPWPPTSHEAAGHNVPQNTAEAAEGAEPGTGTAVTDSPVSATLAADTWVVGTAVSDTAVSDTAVTDSGSADSDRT